MEIVESWVFQVENYFHLCNVDDANKQARFATLLLTKSAAIWLHNAAYNMDYLTWDAYCETVKRVIFFRCLEC